MSFLLDILFPKVCFGCHQVGFYFCPGCRQNINLGKLDHLSHSGVEAHLPVYNDPLIKKAIHCLKYQFCTHLVPDLAKLTGQTLKVKFPLIVEYWHQNNFVLVPVPIHIYRQNWRGFNQASLIGESLAKHLKISFCSDLATKSLFTSSQVKTSHKSQRLKSQLSAFSLNLDKPLPQNIIIFDDVLTTGATCLSFAHIFPKNTNIWLLTLL